MAATKDPNGPLFSLQPHPFNELRTPLTGSEKTWTEFQTGSKKKDSTVFIPATCILKSGRCVSRG